MNRSDFCVDFFSAKIEEARDESFFEYFRIKIKSLTKKSISSIRLCLSHASVDLVWKYLFLNKYIILLESSESSGVS